MNDLRTSAILIATTVLLHACSDGPKTIQEQGGEEENSTGVFSTGDGATSQGAVDPAASKDLHTVVALETLPTTKYIYVRVREADEEFWIATLLQEVTVGRSYFYRGGLLKKDFESKEYARTFDELYLVSQLVPVDHGDAAEGKMGSAGAVQSTATGNTMATAIEGAQPVKIAALIADPQRFDGKAVRLSGRVTKVNPNIMGRNWIHLKDGSKDDHDLVITCAFPLEEGRKVTLVGTVGLNKDFGSGYSYEILVENGTLVE